LPTRDEKQRPSRREVLCALPLLAAVAAALPAPEQRAEEILLVDGWVLARSDLAKL